MESGRQGAGEWEERAGRGDRRGRVRDAAAQQPLIGATYTARLFRKRPFRKRLGEGGEGGGRIWK